MTRNENDVKNRYLSLEKLYFNDPKSCQTEIKDENLRISNVLTNFLSNNPTLHGFTRSNMNENIYADDLGRILMIERNSMVNLEDLNNGFDIDNSFRPINSEN